MKLSEQLDQYPCPGGVGQHLIVCAERAKALEDIIDELMKALGPTYQASPEGREYMDKVADALY